MLFPLDYCVHRLGTQLNMHLCLQAFASGVFLEISLSEPETSICGKGSTLEHLTKKKNVCLASEEKKDSHFAAGK